MLAHLFFVAQTLVHEVLRTPAGPGYMKLFVGFRATTAVGPMIAANDAATFKGMGVPLLKSGQRPRLYSKMHLACFQRKTFKAVSKKRKGDTHAEVVVKGGLAGFSKRFRPEMRTHPLAAAAASAGGGGGCIVPPVCPSLAELGCGTALRAYSAGELEVSLGVPKRTWAGVWALQADGGWKEGPFAL